MYQVIKPTVLIGSSGVGKTFTKEVVEAMASFNEVLFPSQPNILIKLNTIWNWCYLSKKEKKRKSDIGYNDWVVETFDFSPVQPNFTVRVYCWRSLCMERGKTASFSYILNSSSSLIEFWQLLCIELELVPLLTIITLSSVNIHRAERSSLVEAHSMLLSMVGRFLCPARS